MNATVGYSGGNQLILQPNFVRTVSVAAASFDGTDTANVADDLKTSEKNGSKFNPWKKNGGFILKSATAGTINVLTWEDYERMGKVVTDTLAQALLVSAGEWQPTRIVKVYTGGAITSVQIGTVI